MNEKLYIYPNIFPYRESLPASAKKVYFSYMICVITCDGVTSSPLVNIRINRLRGVYQQTSRKFQKFLNLLI